MRKVILGAAITTWGVQAIAHEGHGIDASSVLHYLSGSHLLIPMLLAMCVAGVAYPILRHFKNRE